MVKKCLLIIIFAFLSPIVLAQNLQEKLEGTWVKTDIDMKDGSKYITYYPWDKRYLEFTFLKENYIYNIYPGQAEREAIFNYKLKDNRIIVSNKFEFFIEKISSDSLVLVEKIENIEDDKLKRYYLKRKESLVQDFLNKNINTKKLIAEPYYTPRFQGNFTRYLNQKFKNILGITSLSGYLNFNILSSKLDVELANYPKKLTKIDNAIVQNIQKSFRNWDIKQFKGYESVQIPFIITVKNVGRNRNVSIKLFAQTYEDLRADYGKSLEVMTASSKYFKQGLDDFTNKRYEKAIINFSKSYEIDYTFLDALYNRATTYYLNNQLDKACSDWKKLKEFGQIKAIKLLEQYCDSE